MFIGTLVLLFSAVMITASTSLPVFNKIVQYFNPVFEGRVITDPVPHYNKYQLWIAVFMAALSGFAQYLRFKEKNWGKHLKKFGLNMAIALAVAAVLSFLTLQWIDTEVWQYTVLLFAGWFTVVANLHYVITALRGKLKMAGSAFSHLGFGIMIVGVIASGVNKRVISTNLFMMEGLIQSTGDESLRNNVMLIKNSPMLMEGYRVTYESDTIEQFTRTYTVNFEKLGPNGEVTEEFNVYPNILYNKEFKEIAAYNPSTKRYLDKDIFTHISALPQVEMDFEYRRQREDSLNYKLYELPADGTAILFNDSMRIENPDTTLIYPYRAFLVDINRNPTHRDYEPEPEDLAISAKIGIERLDEDSVFYVEPVLVLRGQLLISYPAQINDIISKVRLNEQIFNKVFTLEEQLDYQAFTFKKGDQITFKGKNIQFAGFNRQPEHPNYETKEGDIAVSAIMSVQDENGQGGTAQPIFFIRDSKPFNIKAEIPSMGLHFRFVRIDPSTDSVEIMMAENETPLSSIPVEIATDSKRSDWIVMAAIEFPGINLFWLGTLLMLLGLTIAMWHRLSTQKPRA
jgi:cytochrome c-type biogenesis protein CcmF